MKQANFKKKHLLFLIMTAALIILAVVLVTPPVKAGGGVIPYAYLPLLRRDCTQYYEAGGIVVIEIEAASLVPDWSEETDLIGFTGDSYYTWRGPNLYGTPGVGVLSYQIVIASEGLYNFRLHNRHDFPNPTEENDVWVKMDNGGWVKAFSSTGGEWTWTTAFDFGTSQVNAQYPLTPGTHTLQISGRSAGFSIDRLVLYLQNGPSAEDTGLPVSSCS